MKKNQDMKFWAYALFLSKKIKDINFYIFKNKDNIYMYYA